MKLWIDAGTAAIVHAVSIKRENRRGMDTFKKEDIQERGWHSLDKADVAKAVLVSQEEELSRKRPPSAWRILAPINCRKKKSAVRSKDYLFSSTIFSSTCS